MFELVILLMGLWAGVSEVKPEKGVISLFVVTMILILLCVVFRLYGKWKQTDTSILRLAYVLTAVSAVIAYPYGEIQDVLDTIKLSIPTVLGAYLMGKSGIYKFKIIGVISLGMIPILLILTRIKGIVVNDSYILLTKDILTLALLIGLLPFAIAFFIRTEIENPFASVVTALPLNQIVLLCWTFFNAFLAGIINNEYGTVLIICGTAALFFLMYGRNMVTKAGFASLCILAMGLVMKKSVKVRTRWMIFTDIEAAMENAPGQALPVDYIQKTAKLSGLYGLGNGELSKATFANVTSDYVISGLLFNCGFLFTLLVLATEVLLILKILCIQTETEYDRIVIQTIAVILMFLTILPFGGATGTFVLTGVGMAFVSVAKAVNLVLFALLGFAYAIKEKGEMVHV